MDSFGNRLRTERTRLGMNQEEFAACGGVQRNAQARYEKDERSPDAEYLSAIAAHGVDVLYVVTGVRAGAGLAAQLTEEQAALLQDYAAVPEEGKAAVRHVLTALAQVAKR